MNTSSKTVITHLFVSRDNFSLWGGSVGARMVGDVVIDRDSLPSKVPAPKAATIVYTGHASYSASYPPTFIMVSEDDPIANAATVDTRVVNLIRAGVDVEYHKSRSTGHGFGIGIGTEAEGRLDKAANFWKEYSDN